MTKERELPALELKYDELSDPKNKMLFMAELSKKKALYVTNLINNHGLTSKELANLPFTIDAKSYLEEVESKSMRSFVMLMTYGEELLIDAVLSKATLSKAFYNSYTPDLDEDFIDDFIDRFGAAGFPSFEMLVVELNSRLDEELEGKENK